ncbi:hypothetical protein F5Y15DRAFT_344342 [Xylariaceae sp. FL0016]|nr:hypothetical protein F5Y15DRAFT_344342 [Xylariaceae sp. FL0016]
MSDWLLQLSLLSIGRVVTVMCLLSSLNCNGRRPFPWDYLIGTAMVEYSSLTAAIINGCQRRYIRRRDKRCGIPTATFLL